MSFTLDTGLHFQAQQIQNTRKIIFIPAGILFEIFHGSVYPAAVDYHNPPLTFRRLTLKVVTDIHAMAHFRKCLRNANE